jgi:hypothetical protein
MFLSCTAIANRADYPSTLGLSGQSIDFVAATLLRWTWNVPIGPVRIRSAN